MKYQPIGYRALFTLAAYNLTQQNVTTISTFGLTEQIGEVRSRGIEAEAKVSLSEGLDIIGSVTHQQTEVTNDGDPTLIGKRPTNIPNDTAALWAFYTFQDGPTRGVGLGGGVRYVGNTAGDDFNSFFVPDYTLFDAALSYDLVNLSPALQGTKLQLNASNLTDMTYVSQCSNDVICLYGLGRTITTTLRYQW